MTGSDHAGECVNAARLANNLVRSLGLTWSDIIVAPPKPRIPRKPDGSVAKWRGMRVFCAQRPNLLNDREAAFIAGLIDWRGDLTERQHAWLCSIYERLVQETSS
jgi:hypothetical protein